jgi:hypothetical protein
MKLKKKTPREPPPMGGANLPEELLRFAQKPGGLYFEFHLDVPENDNSLEKFLNATLDEVRLYHADRYANLVLKLSDLEDGRHFRQGVLRREASRDIEYQKQRDHAAHTLHNYLLGWYMYEYSPSVRVNLEKAIKARFPWKDNSVAVFGNTWPYVSLLHDIGYLFEGGLEILSTEPNSERVRRGGEIVQEYFRHRFWAETPFAAAKERARARELIKIEEPDLSPFTITAVADSLRALGNLETLWDCALQELKHKAVDTRIFDGIDFKG